MVGFFDGDEMAIQGFKVLFGDHHAMRPCLLVLTSYRVLLLRQSGYRRLRRAAGRRADADADQPACPYLQDSAFAYDSIASVKLAFHGQAAALQRPDGSYSRWIWLADRAQTSLFVSHLTRAFERSPPRPLVPQVYTSEAHRHQYAREISYRETEPEIKYASLVYFEDFAVSGELPKLAAQLMYKADADKKWSVGHFVLWDTDLLLYPGAAARTCARWARVIREIMELSVPAQLPSPLPRCVVLTERALYVVEEMAFSRALAPGFEFCPYGHLVQASGQLDCLEAVNADSHGAVHLEFSTAEALESTGSWRLYFVTTAEQRAFIAALLQTCRTVELTVGSISHHMREVCLSGARYVRCRWDGLLDR
ncbi:uncharacterized protein LOC119096693 [Pollicipes pollicipes]|uniref:uncharacterized protein LOC119096693 n=1 Tax=Pollicipes pollicipes TaxID=41117 RepID=UPI001884DE58|nr:uncharacterized protein LOC119096693 [Pollicipes pollicipes]